MRKEKNEKKREQQDAKNRDEKRKQEGWRLRHRRTRGHVERGSDTVPFSG